MTKNAAEKQAARVHARDHGVSYRSALDAVRATHRPEGAGLTSKPDPSARCQPPDRCCGDRRYDDGVRLLLGHQPPVDDRVGIGADVTAPLPGIVDDLAVIAPGRLAVATTTGQLAIADTATRRSCIVQLGQPATSVAVNPENTAELAIGTELGTVLRVALG